MLDENGHFSGQHKNPKINKTEIHGLLHKHGYKRISISGSGTSGTYNLKNKNGDPKHNVNVLPSGKWQHSTFSKTKYGYHQINNDRTEGHGHESLSAHLNKVHSTQHNEEYVASSYTEHLALGGLPHEYKGT